MASATDRLLGVASATTCPYCGGGKIRQITPSQFECVTLHPGGLTLGPGGVPPSLRPCTHRFQVPTDLRTAPCSCGRESIGQCGDCDQRLCGLHGTEGGEFLCAACVKKRRERKFAREAEEERDRQAGLVDFERLLMNARARRS